MKTAATLLLLVLGMAVVPWSYAQDDAAGCERGTAYAASVKVVRFGQKTYVTYLDVQFRSRMAALDQATGNWDGPTVVGQGVDNHAGGALAMTADGTLHLVHGPHGHPMLYVHSLAPENIEHWSEPEEVGVSTTYPSLVATPEGTLHLAYRGHADARGPSKVWQLTFHTRLPAGAWEPGLLLADLPSTTDKARANYHHRLRQDVQGRLHLAWTNILVSPGRIYYLCSADGGKTWSDRPGGPSLPLPVSNQGPAPLYSSEHANLMLAMAPDAAGVPHILYGPEYGSSDVEHVAADGADGWRKLSGFRMSGKTVWLHQASFDRQGRLHATFFAEAPGKWLSNTAVVYQAVWEPRKGWQCRPIADMTRDDRGCFMPAISETNEEMECVFYSGRDLDVATNAKGVHGHVATDVYYANLTRNWLQQVAPKVGPRKTIADEWRRMEE